GVQVNDANPDASRGIAATLAGALPATCGGGPAVPTVAATPTETAAIPAGSNITIKVRITSEYTNSENQTWPYGKHAPVQVVVSPWDSVAGTDAPSIPANFHPVQVTLFYDDQQIGSGQSAPDKQVVNIDFTPPDTTPQGLSLHEFHAVAARQGFGSSDATLDFEVGRGLESIAVSVDGIGGVHRPDDTITIHGQVWAKDTSGSFLAPVAATISVLGAGNSAAGTSDTNGYFTIDYPLSASAATVDLNGFITIDVYATPADKDHFYPGQSAVAVRISAQGTLNITAATNKGVYNPDESVTLTGQVTADGQPVAASVDVVVNGAVLAATVQTGDGGQYQYTFVPSAIPASPQNASQIPPAQRNPPPSSGGAKPGPIIPLQFSSTYVVAVTPHASGYLAGPDGDAYFAVAHPGDACQAQALLVGQVQGTVLAQLNSTQVGGKNLSPFSMLQPGMSVTPNMQVLTHPSSRATFSLPLGGTDAAQVALNGDTTVQIGIYCRDAAGKVHIALLVSNPGQVLVQWPPNANAEITIHTPAGKVSSLHTRYFINVDKDGTTSVTGLEGTARLTDSQGATVDVDGGKQVSVAAGQAVRGVVPGAAQGQVDPQLVAILAAGAAQPPSGVSSTAASSTSPPASKPLIITPYIPWLIAAGGGLLLLGLGLVFVLARARARRPALSAVAPAGTVPMPPAAPFAGIEAQYGYMRTEIAAGRMSLQQCEAALAQMMVQDAYGRTWMLNGNDGRWLVYNGREWVPAEPPGR
ncbi:MAG TPA: hypothetical protein VKY74_16400, partial [Chloroflexia bacterium]|nr:hypothetical protein [Chloroflexia bacterium]